MKTSFFCVVVVLLVTSCSAPKYTASFNNSHDNVEYTRTVKTDSTVTSETSYANEQVLASTFSVPAETKPAKGTMPQVSVDKNERREAVKILRSDIKTYVKEKKKQIHENSYQDFEWDNDLKLAAIFGAAGLVGVMLGGVSVVFAIIGGAALIIAVVFFVQWVLRQ